MLLLTWNLNTRTNIIPQQLKAVSKYNADILAFQEVTNTSKNLLTDQLKTYGYSHIKDSFALSKEHHLLNKKRKYGQLIASKYPLKCRSPKLFDVPWKERILSVDVTTEKGVIELHTTHIPPGSSNGWIKIEMFEGIFKKLNRNSKKLRILCGDFNTPKSELPDGTVITWGDKHSSEDNRWDTGERNVLSVLGKKNLTDVYRKIHGYEKQDFSWHVCHGKKQGRRFDHIFASDELNVVECFYDHNVRIKGLSDHSAMVAVFDL